ncbi:MAG TPA: hypothetical protein VMW21_02290 [Patescibacteria group bacterium]|nr:hypothetical protein [Patescibacteria group bacterium]
MDKNIFESKIYELAAVIRDVIAKGLPPLFRVHRELLKKTENVNSEVICSIEKLSESLGYKPQELESILKDLAILNFIDYQIIDEVSGTWKIKILVH